MFSCLCFRWILSLFSDLVLTKDDDHYTNVRKIWKNMEATKLKHDLGLVDIETALGGLAGHDFQFNRMTNAAYK